MTAMPNDPPPSAIPTQSATNTDFATLKLQREVEKLELELREARVPFWRSPKFLLPILSALILAVIAGVQTVTIKRLTSSEGAVHVLQEKISQHGFNASSLWAIWHVLDERQHLGDKKARELLSGIKSLDHLVAENFPAHSPSYSFDRVNAFNGAYRELRTRSWIDAQSGGAHYEFRSEALRYLLSLRSSIEVLNQVLADKSGETFFLPDRQPISAEERLVFAQHREELRHTYKAFSRQVGKTPRFLEAGNYVLANLMDTQID